jgi:hypothetical protein
VALGEEMFALSKQGDWQACHRRLDAAEPGENREERVSIAYWRATVLARQERYPNALGVLDAGGAEFFSQCGLRYFQAELLCLTGDRDKAIAVLRDAPFAAESEAFAAMANEAMFLLCYLLRRGGEPMPPDLVEAIPDDFRTFMFDERFLDKSDLLSNVDGARDP